MLWNGDKYIGPEEGTVLVHKRFITKDVYKSLSDKDEVFQRFIKLGKEWVINRIGCTERIGCNCCYGDGPDLNIEWFEDSNGDFNIEYYVDFDFKRD